MMSKYTFLTALLITCTFSMLSAPAQAEPKFMGIEWYSEHWQNQDFIPYYEDGMHPQNTQFDNQEWAPAIWIKSSGKSGEDLIKHWQSVGIFGANGVENDAPYINVGPNFYHLSGLDKRRVTATLDAVYQVTDKKPSMFHLRDGKTEKIIGTYTKDGLILQ